MLKFQASTVGRSWGSPRTLALTPFGIGIRPLEGIEGKTNGGRTNSEIESGSIGAGVGQVLIGKHREVLGDHVTEKSSEDSDVKASPVACANDSSRIHLVGNADARSKILEVLADTHGCVVWPIARHAE